MNEVYLSDILDTNAFKKGALNIIQAPCGCGKTHAAINKIATLASCPSKALYLIDTVAGCQRVSNEKNMALPCLYYDEDIVTNHTFDRKPLSKKTRFVSFTNIVYRIDSFRSAFCRLQTVSENICLNLQEEDP